MKSHLPFRQFLDRQRTTQSMLCSTKCHVLQSGFWLLWLEIIRMQTNGCHKVFTCEHCSCAYGRASKSPQSWTVSARGEPKPLQNAVQALLQFMPATLPGKANTVAVKWGFESCRDGAEGDICQNHVFSRTLPEI